MADSAANGANVAEQYSLLPKLMPNLDRHLVYPLLNFSSDEEADQTVEQKKLLLELLKPTNMTDFVGQLHQEVHGLDDMSDEFKTKRDEVLKKRDQLDEAALVALLRDPVAWTEVFARAREIGRAYLAREHTPEQFAARWRETIAPRSAAPAVAASAA